MQDTPDITVAG